MWDSRDRENHWTQKEWPKCDNLKAGMPNVIHEPIVSRGLMKQFVKALHLGGECFQHILCTFPELSYEKIKAGVFDGPQIHTLVCDQAFVQAMNDKENEHQSAFSVQSSGQISRQSWSCQ